MQHDDEETDLEMWLRKCVLAGPTALTTPVAMGLAKRAEEVTGKETHSFVSLAGTAIGTYRWGQFAGDGLSDVVATRDALAEDDEYQRLAAEAAPLVASRVDDWLIINHRPVNDPDFSPGWVMMLLEMDAQPAKLGEALAWGQEACETADEATGTGHALLSLAAGDASHLLFVSLYPDTHTATAGMRALRGHEGFGEMTARGGSLVLPGSSRTSFHERLT